MLQTDLKEAVNSIYIQYRTLYLLQTDLKEAVKSIYMIQDSVCAKDRPDRGILMIYNFVCARDRFIVCKEHVHENKVIDLITSNYLMQILKDLYVLKADLLEAVESIYQLKIRYLT